MSKRIHELAKEWAVAPKDLLTGIEKVGDPREEGAELADRRRGPARPRGDGPGAQSRLFPSGTERVVSDRVVTEASADHIVTAREQTTETRLKANVIRRRTAREVLKTEDAPAQSGSTLEIVADEIPPSLDLNRRHPRRRSPSRHRLRSPPSLPVERSGMPTRRSPNRSWSRPRSSPPAAAVEVVEELPAPVASPAAPPPAAPRPAPVARPTPPPVSAAPPPPGFEEMRGVKVLGKIDLRKPTPPPAPAAKAGEAAPSGDAAGEAPQEEEGPQGHQEVRPLDVMERDMMRPGKRPQKRRALPGKEQNKTEITVPRASKRVIRISEVVTVADLARSMGVKAERGA